MLAMNIEACAGALSGGETLHRLLPAVYDELRRVARRQRRRLPGGETLATTALVHEAYLKIADRPEWQGESHLLGAAAMAMRQILVDYARTGPSGSTVRATPSTISARS